MYYALSPVAAVNRCALSLLSLLLAAPFGLKAAGRDPHSGHPARRCLICHHAQHAGVMVTSMKVALAASARAASGPTTADWLLAWGTIGLAVITLVTLLATIIITRADRRRDNTRFAEERARAEQDRADADQRLNEERNAADQRLREERAYAEQVRLAERRATAVAGLLDRIAELQTFAGFIPLLQGIAFSLVRSRVLGFGSGQETTANPVLLRTIEAIISLQRGDRVEAVMLGDSGATDQYRNLVHLVLTVQGGAVPTEFHTRAVLDLVHYAIFVRCSLQNLVAAGKILDPGYPPMPELTRPTDTVSWSPQNVPSDWMGEIAQTHPEDPQYQPAS